MRKRLSDSSESAKALKRAIRKVSTYFFIGVINSIVAFGLFVLSFSAIGNFVGYSGSLVVAHIISSNIAFVLYKTFVFRDAKLGVESFLKFHSTFIFPLAVNLALLPFIASHLQINFVLAQGLFSIAWGLASFFVHNAFSFSSRRKSYKKGASQEN